MEIQSVVLWDQLLANFEKARSRVPLKKTPKRREGTKN